ncbi:hypothetical protein JXB41_05260 [Candidatus Woesearchaeota archaeon]|nr:hypothetical protein [Candidatus Woesearchaeota archaeon]
MKNTTVGLIDFKYEKNEKFYDGLENFYGIKAEPRTPGEVEKTHDSVVLVNLASMLLEDALEIHTGENQKTIGIGIMLYSTQYPVGYLGRDIDEKALIQLCKHGYSDMLELPYTGFMEDMFSPYNKLIESGVLSEEDLSLNSSWDRELEEYLARVRKEDSAPPQIHSLRLEGMKKLIVHYV